MTSSAERIHEQPATPEQAASLLTEIGTVTTLRGKKYGIRSIYRKPVTEMPTEVTAHLPEVESATSEVSESVYVSQVFDPETGQPRRNGIVGVVGFTRQEKQDPKHNYAAHTDYYITTNDGDTYGMERHVSYTDHGPRKLHETHQKIGRVSIDPNSTAQQMLVGPTELRSNIDAARALEQETGMLTVTQSEADSIIVFMRNLIGEQ